MEIKKAEFEGETLEYVTSMEDEEIETNDFFDMEKTVDLSDISDILLENTTELDINDEEDTEDDGEYV